MNGHAQTREDSVKAAVNLLFQGMINSDSAMIVAAFADSAILQSVGVDKQGKVSIETDKVNDFAQLVASLKKDPPMSVSPSKALGSMAPWRWYGRRTNFISRGNSVTAESIPFSSYL